MTASGGTIGGAGGRGSGTGTGGQSGSPGAGGAGPVGGGAGRGASSSAACSQYSSGQQVGTLFAGPTEISGIVASRKQEDVLWIHEDAGASPILYAISSAGALLGQWRIQGDFRIVDWEDIALESMPGRADRLWVGDVGDNGVRDGEAPRASIRIARVPEPMVDRSVAPPSSPASLPVEDTFTFTYPDMAQDSEAIAVDPTSGDLYIFAKVPSGASGVFRARAPLASGVLELVATLEATSLNGADFSPAGDELLVRNYVSAFHVTGGPAGWPAALGTKPKTIRLQGEAAAEAIAFSADGRGFFTISENAMSPIRFYAKTCN